MENHPAFKPGNVAVITGAADGIGLAAAQCFSEYGMHVVMADIDSEKLDVAAKEIRASKALKDNQIVTRTLDVSQTTQMFELKEFAFETFGQVDVLMNNAGTSRKTSSWDDLDNWRHLIDVNLWGIIYGIHAFTDTMIAQASPGLIINTGSKQGITNPPGNPAYNVSKAGVKAATESLQHALRNTEDCQVSAHLLVPGYTYTGLTKRYVSEKPDGAWLPRQVVDYMIDAINRGGFYIICPDNEVSSAEDARRILWGAGDIAHDRTPLSRWDEAFAEDFKGFSVD
ncbi:MAG: NAD(P)-dependent dehydrogenase (short-subunit alcohol dehydrogenase family) [Gammaproteobacteria bacterium]|jgi:NAD(P)-dependent dehydrogenase (short-subunit alcohol dehydrogenase family)